MLLAGNLLLRLAALPLQYIQIEWHWLALRFGRQRTRILVLLHSHTQALVRMYIRNDLLVGIVIHPHRDVVTPRSAYHLVVLRAIVLHHQGETRRHYTRGMNRAMGWATIHGPQTRWLHLPELRTATAVTILLVLHRAVQLGGPDTMSLQQCLLLLDLQLHCPCRRIIVQVAHRFYQHLLGLVEAPASVENIQEIAHTVAGMLDVGTQRSIPTVLYLPAITMPHRERVFLPARDPVTLVDRLLKVGHLSARTTAAQRHTHVRRDSRITCRVFQP